MNQHEKANALISKRMHEAGSLTTSFMQSLSRRTGGSIEGNNSITKISRDLTSSIIADIEQQMKMSEFSDYSISVDGGRLRIDFE